MNKIPQSSGSSAGGIVGYLGRYPATVAAVVMVLYFGIHFVQPRDNPDDFAYRKFGRMVVVDQGRTKPLDTSARISLMLITHRQGFTNYDEDKSYPATKWYLDSATVAPIFRPDAPPAFDYKIFRIENDEVQRMLKLPRRNTMRYSYNEILPEDGVNEQLLLREVTQIGGDEDRGIPGKDPKEWTLIDGKIMELWQHLQVFRKINMQSAPLAIPVKDADGRVQWKSLAAYMNDFVAKGAAVGDGEDARTFKTYIELLSLYGGADPNLDLAERKREFNRKLTSHLAELDKTQPDRMRRIDAEIFFNDFEPFFWSWIAYVLIAVFAAVSWLSLEAGPTMRRAAFSAMGVVFIVHTAALIMRMWLQNRPPVTNLYSSAIFIGWGCVAISMIAEAIYKNGIATVVGSVLGFLTLIIAHLLSLDGDTMVMMQAVLDTNFWLATHVTCITLGYTTAFVAGFMGIAYILLGVFTNKLRGEAAADLARMTYGVLCTGMFLSFVGTVLGGLWADYSWGRFWGWDPKENGALLIVIWIALILHARWGGMVKQRGIAVLSVMGIVVTGWSWFGTNFLGVGLHAYGGAKGNAMLAMVLIDLFFLGIALLGTMPLEHWQSFRPLPKTDPPAPLPPVAPTAIKTPAAV